MQKKFLLVFVLGLAFLTSPRLVKSDPSPCGLNLWDQGHGTCYVDYRFTWIAVQNIGGDVKNGVIGTGWKTWFTVVNPSDKPAGIRWMPKNQDPVTNFGNMNLWVSEDNGRPKQTFSTAYWLSPGQISTYNLLSAADPVTGQPTQDNVSGTETVRFTVNVADAAALDVQGKVSEVFVNYVAVDGQDSSADDGE